MSENIEELPSGSVRSISPEAAESLYFVREWGEDYFLVNERGHVAVRPIHGDDLAIDVFEVAHQLQSRGTHFPLLLRFQDLLQSRVRALNDVFQGAIAREGYRGTYQGVYPIKVNQLREVVEEILDAGAPFGFGLECGSKAELIATLAYAGDETLLICNGAKDAVMMRLMLEGQEMERNIIPVLERWDEFELFRAVQPEVSVPGQFGVRVRLSTSGAGLWSESGGESSKFGLSLAEVLRLVDQLEDAPETPVFRLLHFHLGSQIADLRNVELAVREAARIYAGLRTRGVPIEYLDIGGGLGVSYEAGNPDVAGHINYTMDDYAEAVVRSLREVCDEENVPHPTIVSESGRAVTAHHSVLIVEVLGVREKARTEGDMPRLDHDLETEFREIMAEVDGAKRDASKLESMYARAEETRLRVADAFRSGGMSLEDKAHYDRLFWTTARMIQVRFESIVNGSSSGQSLVPEGLTQLFARLPDQYLCNFSVFRSVVDHWAIGQRFPIMPLHRLDENPTRRGVIVDLTCDSDGAVHDFVAPTGQKQYLELHDFREGEPYLLGFFLMGAYQDIMGDMHNLFGRVTEAHIYADSEEPGNFYIEKVLDGSTVEEQLALVQYFPNDLERRVNDFVMGKVRSGALKPREAALILNQYKQAFREYTYLNTDPLSGRKRPVRGTVLNRSATD